MVKPSKRKRRRRVITILGVKVKIKYTGKVLYDGEDELHGSFCGRTMTIHVSKESDMDATLLHEICHSVLEISGTNKLINEKTEEAIVCALEAGLKDYFVF